MKKSRRLVGWLLVFAIIAGLSVLWAADRPVLADVDTSTVKWTEEKIMALSREEVFKLWSECPAVDMAELDGEYKGLVPNAGNEAVKKATDDVMFNVDGPLGYWHGKAYKPLSKTTGDGYNRWGRPDGTIERYMRFATKMGTSLIDGKPALLMYYGTYRHRFIPEGTENTLTDELRKLADGVYLGMGTTKMPGGKRSAPGHFVLMGPVAKWQGVDEGNEELE